MSKVESVEVGEVEFAAVLAGSPPADDPIRTTGISRDSSPVLPRLATSTPAAAITKIATQMVSIIVVRLVGCIKSPL